MREGSPKNEDPRVRAYRRDGAAVFASVKDRFGGLSNMAGKYPVRVGDVEARTADALFMACQFPDAPELQEEMLRLPNPIAARSKARANLKGVRDDWDEKMALRVMRWCLRLKLSQHGEFGDLLLSTGEIPIVEESRDDFWGASDDGDGNLSGINAMGRLLMELREELRQKGPEGFLNVASPGIPRLLLLGKAV